MSNCAVNNDKRIFNDRILPINHCYISTIYYPDGAIKVLSTLQKIERNILNEQLLGYHIIIKISTFFKARNYATIIIVTVSYNMAN